MLSDRVQCMMCELKPSMLCQNYQKYLILMVCIMKVVTVWIKKVVRINTTESLGKCWSAVCYQFQCR